MTVNINAKCIISDTSMYISKKGKTMYCIRMDNKNPLPMSNVLCIKCFIFVIP